MNSDMRDWAFRHYVANSLKFIPEGKAYQDTLYDMLNPQPEDNRPADEIVSDIMKRAGLSFDSES